MGTRFTAATESLWNDALKTRVIAAGGDDTEQTRVFDIVRGTPWPEIYPGRVVKNDFFKEWHGREEELAAARDTVGERYSGTSPEDVSIRAV